jgi:hypothetical protein
MKGARAGVHTKTKRKKKGTWAISQPNSCFLYKFNCRYSTSDLIAINYNVQEMELTMILT